MGQSLAPWLLGSLLVPLFVGLGGGALLFDLDAATLATSTTVKLYASASALALLVLAARAAWQRQLPTAGIALGCLLLLAQLGWWSAGRFEGRLDLGEGETHSQWRDVQAGPWARPPGTSVIVVASDSARQAATLRIAGEQRTIAVGEWLPLGDGDLRLIAIHPAPQIRLRGHADDDLHDGYVKITDDRSSFIRLGLLPHRFYVAADAATAYLRITRGKLELFSGEVALGEQISFDSYSLELVEGVSWARLRGRRVPSPLPAVAGALLAIGGALGAVLRRRRR